MSAFTSQTSSYPNGVTNAGPQQTMGAAGSLDPSFSHQFHQDFDAFVASNYSITGVGNGTIALVGGDGGNLAMTTTAGPTDSVCLQLANASFVLKGGKATFFKFAGVLGDTTTESFFTGLANGGATSLSSVQDGILLVKASGASTFVLQAIKAGVVTQVALPAACAPVGGVPFELGLMVDVAGNLAAFYNPTTGPAGTGVAGTSTRGRVAALYTIPATGLGLSLTQVVLAPIVNLTNSVGYAHTATIDYITVTRER